MNAYYKKYSLPGSKNTRMITCDNIEDVALKAYTIATNRNAHIWLNLTNGIECADALRGLGISYSYCRFRSCSFEQGNYGAAIDSMPDDMLMGLALGQQQVIIDFGADKICSRAMYQGIPIASRILSEKWGFNVDEKMWTFSRRGCPIMIDREFAKKAMVLNKRQERRIAYFRKYVGNWVDSINLTAICAPTKNDGSYDFYVGIVQDNAQADIDTLICGLKGNG